MIDILIISSENALRGMPNTSQGASNYQQPQLPTATMPDTNLGTERYLLLLQILSTHSGVWDLYTTE